MPLFLRRVCIYFVLSREAMLTDHGRNQRSGKFLPSAVPRPTVPSRHGRPGLRGSGRSRRPGRLPGFPRFSRNQKPPHFHGCVLTAGSHRPAEAHPRSGAAFPAAKPPPSRKRGRAAAPGCALPLRRGRGRAAGSFLVLFLVVSGAPPAVTEPLGPLLGFGGAEELRGRAPRARNVPSA